MSRSGFYSSLGRSPSARTVEDQRLAVLIREAHERSRRTYGSPRVHAELAAREVFVSRKRVIRIMQQEGLRARVRRRYRCSTMSEHEVVVDLFSRFVVGWALSAANNRFLAMRALEMALQRRCPDAGLLHHSDQGSPYAREDYQQILAGRGITCSRSRRGNVYDNAAMESWFSTLKSELGERFETRASAKEKLFDYIEVFCNQQRRHSVIGYMSPAEFERVARERQVAA